MNIDEFIEGVIFLYHTPNSSNLSGIGEVLERSADRIRFTWLWSPYKPTYVSDSWYTYHDMHSWINNCKIISAHEKLQLTLKRDYQ
jgi:hypothetical protein